MGIKFYKNISDRLKKNIKLDDDIKSYIKDRNIMPDDSFLLIDSSYRAVCETHRASIPKKIKENIKTLDDLVGYLVIKSTLYGKYFDNKRKNNYVFLNILDPDRRINGDLKINREHISKPETPFDTSLDKIKHIKCVGNIIDYLISKILFLANIPKKIKKKIMDVDLSFNKYEIAKISKMSKINKLKVPDIKIIKSKSLIRLTIDRYYIMNYIMKYLSDENKDILITTASRCMSFDTSLLSLDIPQINNITKIKLSTENVDINYDNLDSDVFDIQSISRIIELDDDNKIKKIIMSILHDRDKILNLRKQEREGHIFVYMDGIEADWVIIALSHVLKYTKVYTKDSDILVLGQCDIYGIKSYNNKMLSSMIITSMCRRVDIDDVKKIFISLFSTGCDYINYDGHGASSFCKHVYQYSKYNIKRKTSRKPVDIDAISRYYAYVKRQKSLDSSLSYIEDAIDVLLSCYSFYFKGKCKCRMCF